MLMTTDHAPVSDVVVECDIISITPVAAYTN